VLRSFRLVALASAFVSTMPSCLLTQDLGSNTRASELGGPTEPARETSDATAPEGRRDPDDGATSERDATASDAAIDAGGDAAVEDGSSDAPDGEGDGARDATRDGGHDPLADANAPDASTPSSDPFDSASCVAGPLGAFGLTRVLAEPKPYALVARARSCDEQGVCGAWRAIGPSETIPNAVGGELRPEARSGFVAAAGPAGGAAFTLRSSETCAGNPNQVYGADNCGIRADGSASCTFYYTAQRTGPRGGCDRALAWPGLVGTGSASCIRLSDAYVDARTGTQYQVALLVRF
jgi:hypothetical protein